MAKKYTNNVMTPAEYRAKKNTKKLERRGRKKKK
jgi:hypothetical protein